MGSHENQLREFTCMCGKGKFRISDRIFDKPTEGIDYLWQIDCRHCRDLYNIRRRGNLIGVVHKSDEIEWEETSKQMGKAKSRTLLHKPKFIKVLYEINDAQ